MRNTDTRRGNGPFHPFLDFGKNGTIFTTKTANLGNFHVASKAQMETFSMKHSQSVLLDKLNKFTEFERNRFSGSYRNFGPKIRILANNP